MERSAGESDSNGAVSERSMSDVGVHKRTEEEHTDSLRTSGKGVTLMDFGLIVRLLCKSEEVSWKA